MFPTTGAYRSRSISVDDYVLLFCDHFPPFTTPSPPPIPCSRKCRFCHLKAGREKRKTRFYLMCFFSFLFLFVFLSLFKKLFKVNVKGLLGCMAVVVVFLAALALALNKV